MPVVQKKDIQPLLFNTLKSIQELEAITDKTEDQIARLEELQAFRDKLIKSAPENLRITPQRGELNRYPGIPSGAAGDISRYTFPTLDKKEIKSTTPQIELSPEPTPVIPTEQEDATEIPAQQTQSQQETTEPTPAPKRPVSTDEAQARPTKTRTPRRFAGENAPVTPARPRIQEKQKQQLPLDDLQSIRRRLQRAEMANVRLSQGKEGAALENLQKERDDIREALNATISLERQRYEEKPSLRPDDWGTDGPKATPWDVLSKERPINLDELPEQIRFTQQEQKRFAKEPGEVPQGPGKQEYINDQIKRIINDIKATERNIDKLDQRIPDQEKRMRTFEKEIDNLKDQLKYYQSIKDVGIENKWLSDEYEALNKKLIDSLTPEQQEAFNKGESIDINKVPNKQAFIRNLRELGRELDRIGQSSQDEFEYLQANPQNTVQDFRAMDPESRRDALEDIKRQNFMKKIAEGIDDFYAQNRVKGKDPERFDQIEDPNTQQQWYKRFAASEAKKGAPGMTGNEINKYLMGGGEQFISKYPPELYNKMVQAARRGFGGMEQASNRLSSLAMQDPWELIYGQAAPAQRQFATGAGQAPMVPQLPQEYAFTPMQPQNQLSQALQQGLQKSPTTEIPQNAANQLINSKLANLLQGA